MDGSTSRTELRREVLNAARGLSAGDEALVDVLRDLERERGRATETVRSVVRALAVTLQVRDGYTGEHADAVHDLSVAVGGRLGLEAAGMAELATVALLHDVGKIGVPDGILHKPGPLSEGEWELMRTHPVIGERILSSVPGLEAVARAVRHEHERWDGGGYPDGLAGAAIPLPSRIVLACDAWHALISDRPYRRALDRDTAIGELLRNAGTQFDPDVIEALVGVLERPSAVTARPDPGAVAAPGVGDGTLERELVALISVASAVAAAHKLEDVLDVAAEESREAVGAAALSIERWIADRGILRTLVNVGDLAPGEERYPVDEIYEVDGDGVLRGVLEEGGTHFCSLDDQDVPPVERRLLTALGKHSAVAVPIMFGSETWGQIWATRSAGQPNFDARDARFLHAIAGQVGAAIGRAEVFSRVSELANSDGLTGLGNRRAFDEALEVSALEARRDGADLALVLCDLDNLKELNDHHGHEAGDAALRATAQALQRAVDVSTGAQVFRIGGDEFCVLLHRADASRGRDVAEEVLRRLSGIVPPIGISCGVAEMRAGHGRPADLLRAADSAQYAAKRAGRGRVFVAGPQGAVPSAHVVARPDGRTRALRDRPAIDGGRLLVETLGILDGPLAGALPAERLGGLMRRVAEAIDAVGWSVSYAHEGGEPIAIAVAARPGSVVPLAGRRSWLSGPDLLALRIARPGAASGSGMLVEADEPGLSAVVRRRLDAARLDALLVMMLTSPAGTWYAELGADARSGRLADVEPLLRVLVPQALRAAQGGDRIAALSG